MFWRWHKWDILEQKKQDIPCPGSYLATSSVHGGARGSTGYLDALVSETRRVHEGYTQVRWTVCAPLRTFRQSRLFSEQALHCDKIIQRPLDRAHEEGWREKGFRRQLG